MLRAKFCNGFMKGWIKFTKLFSKPSTNFLGTMKCTKFVIDEIYEIDQFLAEFEYEYWRICVV